VSGRDVTIVGAGLGGALMAVYLGRAGYRVQCYEARRDPRVGTGDEGRSINLAISERGLHAFREVGLEDRILADAVPMRGRMMHATDGRLTFQPYGTAEHHVINSVSRTGLNIQLLDAAETLENVSLAFEHRAVDVGLDEGAVQFSTPAGPVATAADFVIGADGAFSAVRRRLQRTDRFDYSQQYLRHGYKELTIPAAPDGGFRLEPHALHIWPRGGFMMIALPNADGSFTCTLFWPFTGPNGLESLTDEAGVLRFFDRHFPDAVPLMPDLTAQYLGHRNSSLVTIRCGPWFHGDRLVLLGDACHAVVPFYGQGANAAFEDCTVLNACLAEAPDPTRAFAAYYRARKEHTDALADLAIANFVEMRDRVTSPLFLWRKRWEKRLHRIFPAWYVPLYTMVSFTRIPYRDALRRARRQDRTVSVVGLIILVSVLAVAGVWLWP